MNVSDINRNRCVLKRSIDKAILHSMISISNPSIKLQEPDYVAALTTIFVKDFFDILNNIFPNYDFSVSGVFCHQKPIVNINLNKNLELGDILFVYKDKNKNGEVKLNSLLLQAKVNKSNNDWLVVDKNDLHQLELYKKWPKFKYHRAGSLNARQRNIFPKSINDGAQYLIINEKPLKCKSSLICEDKLRCECCCGIKQFSMYCAVPDNILYCNESLSNELINLLKFKSGRTFDESSENTDDWSKMIRDLLTILKTSYSKRKNINLDSFNRLKEYNCYSCYCTQDLNGKTLLDDFLTEDRNNEMTDDNDIGVSVILIESQPKEQYEG